MVLGEYSKRSAYILIIVCGIVGIAMLSAPVVADGIEELDGEGTAEDPYVVTNATELQAIADEPNADYVLGDDIDARATTDWNGGAGLEPIGDGDERFTGSFDGNGHAISNLTIDRPDGANVSLFGVVDSGTITNVTLENASVVGGASVGGLIGHGRNATVSASSATGDVLGNGSDETNVGGLIGWNDRGEVLESSAAGTVTGDGANVSVGGLVGQNYRGGVIKSAATGTVTSGGKNVSVGGLVGSNYQGMVFDSFAAGPLPDAADSVQRGGLVGSSTSATVLDSYWDSERTGLASSDGSPTSAGLNTSQLTGATVAGTTELRVGETWVVTDGYPQLRSHVTNYTLALESTELEADETTAATVALEFADGTAASAATVSNYSSSDSGVATVENGTVEAVDDGEATITAELAGFSETVGLEVSASSSPPSFSPPSGPAPDPGSDSDSDSGQAPEITVRDVSISETSIVEGDNVTVTAMLENTGDAGGERTVSLLVNDEQVRSKTVALSPGESTTVVLEHAVTETGSYTLSVADETFNVTVDSASDDADEGETETETETETPTEDEGTETERTEENASGTDDSVPGFGAVSAVLVLLSIGLLARRRR